jgi:Zn-dependent protease
LGYFFAILIFLVSLTVHEYAHAWMAYRYGDDTAMRMGRLTLNPLAHITLFGTIIMPLIAHFGWAKPVPVDFSVLTKRQMFNVAAAGPAVNLLMAVVLAGVFHIVRRAAVPMLDYFVSLAVFLNLLLAVFNLLPVPPLDGSRLVYARLKSPEAIEAYNRFARFGMVIVIGFLLLGGLEHIIVPVVGLLYTLLGLPVPALTIRQIEGNKG